LAMARSTPAQNARGLASRISTSAIFSRGAPRVGRVERRLESGMGAAQAVDHPLRPVEIFTAPRQVPFRRRPLGDVAQVAELVGELHQLRLVRELRRVLDLQALALGLGQALVVSDFGDGTRDV